MTRTTYVGLSPCTDPNAPGSRCRAFRLTYPSATEVHVYDPAGRPGDAAGRQPTIHRLDSADPATRRLVQVVNPDGTALSYAYQGGRRPAGGAWASSAA